MKRFLLLSSVLLTASCSRDRIPDAATDTGAMQGMPGMPGMEGMTMPAAGAESLGITLDRIRAARLGITFARAAERPLTSGIRAVGVLRYAEPSLAIVSARVDGWVEELYADFAGKRVAAGEPLLALYSPELVSAQEEFLLARRLGDDSLAAMARRRLALWDVPPDQIDSLVAGGVAQRRILLRSPRDGEIVEKMVVRGQMVHAGDNLFRIADRRVLWAEVAVFERDAAALRVGIPATISVDAVPARTFSGRVTFISPELDDRTRTLTARVEIANDGGTLRPGMYATAELRPAGRRVLSVPLGAVLPTGTRDIVFVNRGDGRFLPREVRVGQRGDSTLEIVQGLRAGDEVIASATFLLDSESNLAAAIQGLMLQMGMGLDMGDMPMPGMDTAKARPPAGRPERRP